jgi:hypothetical protein
MAAEGEPGGVPAPEDDKCRADCDLQSAAAPDNRLPVLRAPAPSCDNIIGGDDVK